MDRSLSYDNGVWSVPNLYPTRAQTAASAYRQPRPRGGSIGDVDEHMLFPRPSTGTAGMGRHALQGANTRRPLTVSSHDSRRHAGGGSRRSRYTGRRKRQHDASQIDISAENVTLREYVAKLERRLAQTEKELAQSQLEVQRAHSRRSGLLSRGSIGTVSSMGSSVYSPRTETTGNGGGHLIHIDDDKPVFDPASDLHPREFTTETPPEVWRPTIAPRPLSPLRQMGRLESLSMAVNNDDKSHEDMHSKQYAHNSNSRGNREDEPAALESKQRKQSGKGKKKKKKKVSASCLQIMLPYYPGLLIASHQSAPPLQLFTRSHIHTHAFRREFGAWAENSNRKRSMTLHSTATCWKSGSVRTTVNKSNSGVCPHRCVLLVTRLHGSC